MHMVKVISLSEPAYALLKSYKQEGMSFSDVVCQLAAKPKTRLSELAGILTEKEADELEKEVKDLRKRARKRMKNLEEELNDL